MRAVACQGALEVKTWFPDNPSLEFFAGKVGPAIIGARNPTSTSVNITAAYGQLAMVNNPDGAIYNFSAMVRERVYSISTTLITLYPPLCSLIPTITVLPVLLLSAGLPAASAQPWRGNHRRVRHRIA